MPKNSFALAVCQLRTETDYEETMEKPDACSVRPLLPVQR